MKIYTKKGDKGETSLLGGTRVPKNHIRIESYGTVDELNSYIGLIRDHDIDEHSKNILMKTQDILFTVGSYLASDPKKSKVKIPELKEDDVKLLETEMDKMNALIPELRSFVLPGGHITVSHCHIARCICRRAERCVVHLSQNSEVSELVIKYLNRLSDYLFVLARTLSYEVKAVEKAWEPSLN